MTGGADTAAPVACETASTCPKPANPCEVAVCVGGLCEASPAPAGTFVPDETQLAGDCKTITCGDGGAFATAADPDDVPEDDGNPCTREACDGPNATHPEVAVGSACPGADGEASGVCVAGGVCAECQPGQVTCDGAVPRSCDADGAWVSEEACPFVCSGAGQCAGVCVPGTRDCAGKQPRLCDAAGQWQADGAMCDYVCVSGACDGSCTPGNLQCNANIPQSCNEEGVWQATPACPFACVSGQCTGLCVPASTRCQGTAIQTCGPTGQWTTTNSCPFLCDGGTCGGVCTPGTKRCVGRTSQTCDGNGQWVESQTCMFACSAGDCTGVCEPGATRCSGHLAQTCDSQGQWQTTDSCVNACLGAGTCGGVCRPGATRCTGQNAETCDQTGQWVATPCANACQNGSCTGVCQPGATRCDGARAQSCNASGQWTTTQTCPYVCSGAGTCSGQCAPSSTRCSGTTPQTCDAAGAWSSLADCTYACQSGACTGVCRPGGTRCVGNAAQTCDATGQWQTSQTCPYICASGTCGGVCVPGTTRCSGHTPQTCDQNAQWSGSTACSGATPTCSDGACVDLSYAVAFQTTSQDARVKVPQPASLIGKPATVEAWVKMTGERSFSTLFNTGGAVRALYMGGSGYGSARGGIALFNDATGQDILRTTAKLALNTWFHLALTHDGSTLRIFLNGVLAGSAAFSNQWLVNGQAPIGETGAVMQFCGCARAGEEAFIGQIDELRLSSGARYTTDFTPPARLVADATTVVLLSFDQGSGATVQSDVAGGPTGTLVGTPTPTYVVVNR